MQRFNHKLKQHAQSQQSCWLFSVYVACDPLTGLVWQHETRSEMSPVNEVRWEMGRGWKTDAGVNELEGKSRIHVGRRAVDRHLRQAVVQPLCRHNKLWSLSPFPSPSSPLASAGPAVWGPGAWDPGNNGGIDRCAWDGQLQLPYHLMRSNRSRGNYCSCIAPENWDGELQNTRKCKWDK